METGMSFQGGTSQEIERERSCLGLEAMTHLSETGAAGRSRTDRKIEWGRMWAFLLV